MSDTIRTDALFDLSHTEARPLFLVARYPWEVIPAIREFVLSLIALLPEEEYRELAPEVLVHRSCRLSDGAAILGPTVIGPQCEIRHGAYLRGGVLLGQGCCIGNSTEVKNSILFDGAQAPHYNYVGDSVLGFCAHLGAGAIASNLRADRAPVTVYANGRSYPTGLKKLGALIGDHAEIGCQSVLCPGSIVGKGAQVYPLVRVRGTVAAGYIMKDEGVSVPREVRV